LLFFLGDVFCAFLKKGEFKNGTKTFPVAYSKHLFPVIPPLQFGFIAFLAVFLHGELKNTTQISHKKPETCNLKIAKTAKTMHNAGRYIAFSAPCAYLNSYRL
jgi:hypothetical protein